MGTFLSNLGQITHTKRFRHRYGAEMRRDFRELSWEGLAEGGARGLAGVLAVGISDLAVTALAEWSSAAARRRGALPWSVDPQMAARAMAPLVWVSLLIALLVWSWSLSQTPRYEATARVLVGERSPAQETGNGKIQPIPNANPHHRLQDLTLTVAAAADTKPVAQAVVEQLHFPGQSAGGVLQNMTATQDTGTTFVTITYTSSNPRQAQLTANAIGKALSEKISEVSPGAKGITATIWSQATLPQEPVSPKPLRNGLIALVGWLALCAGLALVLPGRSAASVAGGPGGRNFCRGVGRAGVLAAAPATGRGVAEGTREMELLRALGRRGKLTALGAALVTSLSVGEAERMLQALAAEGHLEVTVEQGRLLYSLWEGDAPT